MNDKEAFEVWFHGTSNSQFAKFLRDNYPEVGNRWDRESCKSAWQAALSYRDKQIAEGMKGACPTCEPVATAMSLKETDIQRLQAENKQLLTENGILSGEIITYKKMSDDALKKIAEATETLEYYGNRMGSGGTAREALKKIKGDWRNV